MVSWTPNLLLPVLTGSSNRQEGQLTGAALVSDRDFLASHSRRDQRRRCACRPGPNYDSSMLDGWVEISQQGPAIAGDGIISISGALKLCA